ncbi:threalose-6-phosphate phosphatase [Entophlyctis luteolus]|nr:threalose-6-phosphate phosphatase [Entophlyctis luteolus]
MPTQGDAARCKVITATHLLPVQLHVAHPDADADDPHALDPVISASPRRGHSAIYSGLRAVSRVFEHVHVGLCAPDSSLCIVSGSNSESIGESPSLAKVVDRRTPPATPPPAAQSPPPVSQSAILRFLSSGAVDSPTGCALHPVFVPAQTASNHYEGYCKAVLWPLFHYMLWDSADANAQSRHWKDYVAVNRAFADAIIELYSPGDLVWVHDYHLLLVPAMVRNALPNAAVGLFLHTPKTELITTERQEILTAMLGSNMIGFQTYSYARHFISSCSRVLGLESSPKGVDYKGFQVAIEIFPIGIDVDRVLGRLRDSTVRDKMASIREVYAGKYIIVGRDKLDQIKGVEHKMLAFEKFLALYPDWRNKVVLIQVTTPPHHDASRLESKITDLVSRINGTFGSLESVPVHHYHHHLEVDDYFALLSVADVGLITSVRDGMNTTSHEYVVCQNSSNHGPLILSEFAGTAGSLGGAILVNPWDYTGVAHAIHEALTQSKEEKLNRHNQLYKYVSLRTAEFWAKSFVKELQPSTQVPLQANPTPYLNFEFVRERYAASSRRMLLFDYDGTLTPIVKTPSAAHPPPEMLRALRVLAADPKNYVFVISGRDQAALDAWLGNIDGLGLSAEHGCFVKYPGDSKWQNLTEQIDLSWKNEVTEIFSYYTERTQGSFIEHKQSSITWHYRLADPDYGIFQAKECQNHLEHAIGSKLPVEILIGKKNLEVRPISINKGEIVKTLLDAQPAPGPDFVLCAGDDKTDEDMFKTLLRSDLGEDECFSVTVGPATKKTKATWHVQQPAELIQLLGKLAGTDGCDDAGEGKTRQNGGSER